MSFGKTVAQLKAELAVAEFMEAIEKVSFTTEGKDIRFRPETDESGCLQKGLIISIANQSLFIKDRDGFLAHFCGLIDRFTKNPVARLHNEDNPFAALCGGSNLVHRTTAVVNTEGDM